MRPGMAQIKQKLILFRMPIPNGFHFALDENLPTYFSFHFLGPFHLSLVHNVSSLQIKLCYRLWVSPNNHYSRLLPNSLRDLLVDTTQIVRSGLWCNIRQINGWLKALRNEIWLRYCYSKTLNANLILEAKWGYLWTNLWYGLNWVDSINSFLTIQKLQQVRYAKLECRLYLCLVHASNINCSWW